MNDIKIKCLDCNTEFVFSEAEQRFYEEHNFVPPKRCKACRNARTLRHDHTTSTNNYKTNYRSERRNSYGCK